MGEHESPGKPFDISKREVWQAYQKVAANKGAAGVDGVSLAEFESDLRGNLYKIWNRMSSRLARSIRRLGRVDLYLSHVRIRRPRSPRHSRRSPPPGTPA